MELEKLKKLVSKKSIEYNLNSQLIWDSFFFERFLKRLAKSEYNDCFIFKGGFLLQSIVGIKNRTTLDIDLKIISNNYNDNELLIIFANICNVNIDEIIYRVMDINNIKAGTKYGGKTLRIEARLYNIKKIFSVDVGIGDVVTPGPINYYYHSNIFDDSFNILSYPIETIIAEKFETLISKGVNNSRSKDLFDLYLLMNRETNDDLINSAMINTFNLRKTEYNYEFINDSLQKILSLDTIKLLYDKYLLKKAFANNISFDDCKRAIYQLFNKLVFLDKIELKEYGIELHVIRHGQDEKNKVGGWSDSHLIEDGIKEIKGLLNELDDDYDLFISSDLNRCKESSLIINERLDMNIIFDSNFREINNGILKNLKIEEFEKNYKKLNFLSLKIDEKYPDGESPNDFFVRVSKAFIKLLDQNRNKKILLVTHGGVITIIKCLLNGYKYSNQLKIAPKTGSISIFK